MRVLSVICVLSLLPLISVAQAKQVLPGPFPFELVEVIDGDTFRARVDIWLGQSVTVRVRLKGVDTPEMEGKCAAEKKLARQAKAFAENWFKKNQAQLVNVHYGTYAGRVLATAQIKNGESLSAALLAENLAKPYRGRRAQWCD
ncbi:MAG: nuclease [Rhodobiaceae bacterium]|nr:nuclease [Rhodobiaceae bacterium]|tara:strand:- start:876 stop:1307 length:432 start_codon:yes stop_codon:yes gene_type:complete